MRVAAITIFPVKGLRGLAAGSADIDGRGVYADRRAMIVDEASRFLSQREVPPLATFAVEEDGRDLVISSPAGTVRVDQRRHGPRRTVRIWQDEVDAVAGDPTVDAALSEWLGRPVALVHMDRKARRTVDPAWSKGSEVSFADGFPILLTCTASLFELNRRMAERGAAPVAMERFRPNIVVETDEPFVEDGWTEIAIGDAELALVKPCARCVVTTTDQETGAVATDNEPLATLATFRRSVDRRTPGVLFGWNATVTSGGNVFVGQPVEVLATRAEPWPVR